MLKVFVFGPQAAESYMVNLVFSPQQTTAKWICFVLLDNRLQCINSSSGKIESNLASTMHVLKNPEAANIEDAEELALEEVLFALLKAMNFKEVAQISLQKLSNFVFELPTYHVLT